jgi:3-oxoacyl-[acyl-carrier protein] reductase
MPVDTYGQVVNSPVGRFVAKRAGLPRPVELERRAPGDPVVRGRMLLGAAAGDARLVAAIGRVLASANAEVATSLEEPVRSAAAAPRLDASVFNPDAPGDQRFKALVFDATAIADSTQLVALHAFFHRTVRRLESSGRVVVLGTPPRSCATPREATAQRALEGFTRSLGKEVGRGATVQLVEVEPAAEERIESTLRFLLSPRSAYVSGQVVRVGPSPPHPEVDWQLPLAGRVALVTGAARGIGAAIAEVLARDGARVVGLDVPALGDELRAVTERLGGEAM